MPGIEFNNRNRSSLDSSIKIILFILDKISKDRKKGLESQLNKLFEAKRNNAVIKEIVENKIGYKYI